MAEPTGLRERKRERTHRALSDAAIALFLKHGFDRVSVADVAAAAEVSKPTLFKYFATKEDLVLHRVTDHRGESARVVRDAPDRPPLTALRRHFLDGLRRHDPVTGLSDAPEVLAYHRMVFATPSLLARLAEHAAREEEELAAALAERRGPGDAGADLTSGPAAAQVIAVMRVLARANWRALADGRDAAAALPDALAGAEHAFDLLDTGLAAHLA
ncbi:TetR/AcrR family transcriptional regulator [Actinomadura xylanilytica]|uniref:TetR/AcrR family transcriptional regulator n=1 Tax=Actinomadura xylanilytica TaxID=887459 RepID=UPI00255AE1B1|nr:TetR/AcrR family transcriptional regulator [Actinomadura xylanilytica]MDL4774945.1 TetR/AcrR family transcriptional regulator [Actinomadura xylanilytica]